MTRRFEFCRVCRQNHNKGKGHRYSIKHKHCLELLLGKCQEQLQEVRHSVKNIGPVTDIAQNRTKLWCHFCEQESTEEQSLIVCAQAIKHFASQKHLENVKSFLTENGGDVGKQHMYVLEGIDLAKLEEASKVVPAVVGVDGPPKSSVNNIIESHEYSAVVPLIKGDLKNSVSTAGFATIGVPLSKLSKYGEGNVHSGAAPPWLKQNNAKKDAVLIGAGSSSSNSLPLSKTQERKLAKIRNPHRVGAEWAERRRAGLKGETMTQSVDDIGTWFPSFGRVWQSGSRQDTRKEFEAEKRLDLGKKGRGGRVLAKKKTTLRSMELKPYISRQQRMATLVSPK